MKTKVYIDGQSGTTGLQIYERIGSRKDLDLLRIDEDKRHDVEERRKYLNEADIVFLCLPDEGAREAVELVENPAVRIIDASTAHRTDPSWVYGFPELFPSQRDQIRRGGRIANPGCHATGFLAAAAPLVQMGILPAEYPVTCYSLTGYSGGGKKMIADYQAKDRKSDLSSPGLYGLSLCHKHLPEMQKLSGLTYPPAFVPVVDDYEQGMATSILLHNRLLPGKPSARELQERLAAYYEGEQFVQVMPFAENPGTIYAGSLAGTNRLDLFVCGHKDQTLITSRFDNLGKGASGAAVQNMNIMLGLPEETGLVSAC